MYNDYVNELVFEEMAKDYEESQRQIEEFLGYENLAQGVDAVYPSASIQYQAPKLPDRVTIVDKKDYDKAAEMWLSDMGTWQGHRTVQHIGGTWYAWVGTHWQVLNKGKINNLIRPYFVKATIGLGVDVKKLNPDVNYITNVVAALESLVCERKEKVFDVGVSSWLTTVPGYPPNANEYLPMANGLLHWPTRVLYPHTPAYWSLSSLPHEWRDGLGSPNAIIKVLTDQFGDRDPEAVGTLQEVCGYILTGGRWLEKAFALIGQQRSGKSTLADALAQAVGRENTAVLSLNDTTDFGYETVLGSRLISLSDVRMSNKSGKTAEFILNVTGQDVINVHRKYQTSVTTRIESNILLHSNELPSFFDDSRAVANRFIIFEFARSFYGQEDPYLKARVSNEIPEFIGWALDGYERLLARGYLRVPASSQKLMDSMLDASSDIGRFFDAWNYEVTGNVEDVVTYDTLWQQYEQWAKSEGMKVYRNTLSKKLFAFNASIGTKKNAVKIGGRRISVYTGLRRVD